MILPSSAYASALPTWAGNPGTGDDDVGDRRLMRQLGANDTQQHQSRHEPDASGSPQYFGPRGHATYSFARVCRVAYYSNTWQCPWDHVAFDSKCRQWPRAAAGTAHSVADLRDCARRLRAYRQYRDDDGGQPGRRRQSRLHRRRRSGRGDRYRWQRARRRPPAGRDPQGDVEAGSLCDRYACPPRSHLRERGVRARCEPHL